MKCVAGRCFAVRPRRALFKSCTTADLFSDCFQGCTSPAACGWTVLTPPGTVSFDGTQMNVGPFGADPQGIAIKPAVIPAAGITFQFQFTEIPILAPPSTFNSYASGSIDALGDINQLIDFSGDDMVVRVVLTGAVEYMGAWTPSAGATRTAHLTVDGALTPLLYLDQVPIPLTPTGLFPVSLIPNVVFAALANDNFNGQGAFHKIAVATGVLPPSTNFCCP